MATEPDILDRESSKTAEEEVTQTDTDSMVEQRLPPSRWLVLAVPLMAICLGGSKEPVVLGTFAILVGLCHLLSPARFRVPLPIQLPVLAMLGICLSAFLPLPSASEPAWRHTLTADYGILLSGLRTPQPWVTLEAWLLMAVGCSWMFYCLGRGFHTPERRFHLKALSFSVAAIAIAAIYVRRQNISVPLWTSDWPGLFHFGPFVNRNHFGTLLSIGGLTAFASAYDALRNRRASWILQGLCIAPMFAGLMLNTSRAGVILFFTGLVGWMALAGFRKSAAKRMAVFASLLLLLASVFLIAGKPVVDRFANSGGVANMAKSDARFYLFSETLNMAAQSPFLGVGLGNFEPIFAITKTYTNHLTRNLHPESDWLWFLGEAGGVAWALAVIAVLATITKMTSLRSGDGKGTRERRLRNAALVAVLLVILHGLVDTPSHTIGIWALVCLMAGLGLRPSKLHRLEGFLARSANGAMGVACLGVGALWLSNACGSSQLPCESLAVRLHRDAVALAEAQDFAAAVRKTSQAITLRPLQWDYYFDRAQWSLDMGRPSQEALMDFARARELEPHSGILCVRESMIWLDHDPVYALPALREGMQRDKTRAYGPFGFYGAVLQHLKDHPELRIPLLDLATEPALKLVYLQYAISDEDFRMALNLLLDQQPTLASLSSSERKTLFRLWYQRGDRSALVKALQSNADWKPDGWAILADNCASQGDFQGAYQLATDYLPQPVGAEASRSADLGQLRREFLFNPTDVARGLRLADALKNKAMLDEAISVLDKVAVLPGVPNSVYYEQAQILARKNDYQKAWDRLKTYMSAIPKES